MTFTCIHCFKEFDSNKQWFYTRHQSTCLVPWWVQILCWIWKVFSKWEILKFVWNQVLRKSFSLNPEWNKQKENDYLMTIVFFFQAIIGEAQSSVFYVTHALPFKIWTNSIFMLFDLILFEDLEILTSFCFSSSTTENVEYSSLYLSWMRSDLRQHWKTQATPVKKHLFETSARIHRARNWGIRLVFTRTQWVLFLWILDNVIFTSLVFLTSEFTSFPSHQGLVKSGVYVPPTLVS